ncbi:hypothetical protein MBLNU459_g5212t1 [Dothideomycetes sp. NU459]
MSHETENRASPSPVDEEEGEDCYHKGGFHPVRLGDVFNQKYEVLRKLGHGCYSTVWLVRNQDDGKFWALKVLSAECYGAGTDLFEVEVLKQLRQANIDHAGYQYISTIEDSFEHHGPNGSHVCLIFKVMGESLSTFCQWFTGDRIPRPVVNEFTIQLLQALDYAHSSGIIHTDIKPSNIMVQIPNEDFIAGYLKATESEIKISSRTDGIQVVATQGLRDFYFLDQGISVMTLKIALSDWGVASWTHKHLTEHIQPVLLRAPEVIIGAPWGPAVDVWNLGALIPELIYGQMMFSGRLPSGEYSEKYHLEEIVDLFGPLPRSMLEDADPQTVRDIFDAHGDIQDPQGSMWTSLEDRFADMKTTERVAFVAFINMMLSVNPKTRKPAKDLLDESWLKHDYSDEYGLRVEEEEGSVTKSGDEEGV